jgi:hypothetical protein
LAIAGAAAPPTLHVKEMRAAFCFPERMPSPRNLNPNFLAVAPSDQREKHSYLHTHPVRGDV